MLDRLSNFFLVSSLRAKGRSAATGTACAIAAAGFIQYVFGRVMKIRDHRIEIDQLMQPG
jgi:hypothetical protein